MRRVDLREGEVYAVPYRRPHDYPRGAHERDRAVCLTLQEIVPLTSRSMTPPPEIPVWTHYGDVRVPGRRRLPSDRGSDVGVIMARLNDDGTPNLETAFVARITSVFATWADVEAQLAAWQEARKVKSERQAARSAALDVQRRAAAAAIRSRGLATSAVPDDRHGVVGMGDDLRPYVSIGYGSLLRLLGVSEPES